MATEVKRFSGTLTKFQVTTAACAVAAAAVLTPAVAQADLSVPAPMAPVSDIATSPYIGEPLFDELLPWWVYRDNPSEEAPPLPPTTIFEFSPLAFVPGFLQPLYRALTANIDFGVCIGSIGFRVGPYGTFSVSRGC